MSSNNKIKLPKIEELGYDLLDTSTFQRWLAIIRPFLALLVFIMAAYAQIYWLLPIAVFLIFVSVVSVTHDIVHNNIGLNPKQTELTLFIMGSILLESSHAYRQTHFYHHQNFPDHDDLEGVPARLGFLGSILHGPIFIPRLWIWAFRHSKPKTGLRRWLIIEALLPFLFVLSGILFWSTTPLIMVYAILIICGSWVYPVLNVYWLHKDYGDNVLNQSHTVRGWVISELFLGLTYHLEHHLYPQVPSHNLPLLAKRLDPFFKEQGVKFYNLI